MTWNFFPLKVQNFFSFCLFKQSARCFKVRTCVGQSTLIRQSAAWFLKVGSSKSYPLLSHLTLPEQLLERGALERDANCSLTARDVLIYIFLRFSASETERENWAQAKFRGSCSKQCNRKRTRCLPHIQCNHSSELCIAQLFPICWCSRDRRSLEK